jgi:hypothetical protein
MVRVGCGDGALISCDNQPGPQRNRCNPEFEYVPSTIALYDAPGGNLVGRLHDSGQGVPFERVDEEESWMRIRTCGTTDSVEGWVNWEEGFSSMSRIRFK